MTEVDYRREAEVLRRIKEVTHSIEPEAELILFGSRARGEARHDSDYDVAILTDRPINFAYEQKFLHEFFHIDLDMETFIQPFLFPKSSWNAGASPIPLVDNIRNDGKKL